MNRVYYALTKTKYNRNTYIRKRWMHTTRQDPENPRHWLFIAIAAASVYSYNKVFRCNG